MRRAHAFWTLAIVLSALLALPSPAPVALSEQIPPDSSDDALLDAIKSSLPADGTLWGVVVKNLDSGQTATLNADTVFVSASLYKLAVMYEAYRQNRAGTFTLNSYTQSQIRAMITWSDNASAWALFTRLGQNRINATMKDIGLPHTLIGDPTTTTPREMATLMEMIYHGEAVDVSASRDMLNLLLAQQVNDRLPRLLPSGTPVAHKTGNLDDCVHDVGIVYAPNGPYVIAVLTRRVYFQDQTAYDIAKLSKAVYDYFKYNQATATPQGTLPYPPSLSSPTQLYPTSTPQVTSTATLTPVPGEEPTPYSPNSTPQAPQEQAGRSRFFVETAHYVGGPFLTFFDAHGGIEVFGYPLTEAFYENGLKVQYFQRQRLEWWPENSEPFTVQLTLIGDETLGPGDPPVPSESIPSARDVGSRYFPETGHLVSGAFKQYFDRRGGLEILGYPTSEQYYDAGVLVQRFQRGRMEYHPENPSYFKVQLALLGYDLVVKNRVPTKELAPVAGPTS